MTGALTAMPCLLVFAPFLVERIFEHTLAAIFTYRFEPFDLDVFLAYRATVRTRIALHSREAEETSHAGAAHHIIAQCAFEV